MQIKFIPFLCALLWSGLIFAQTEVNSEIRETTVYRQMAQITRTGEARLTSGKGTVVLTGLSPNLDPSSVRLGATGEFTILSVNYRNNFLDPPTETPEFTKLETDRDAIKYTLERDKISAAILQEEENLILANKSIGGTQNGVSVDDLMQLAQFVRERLAVIRLEKLEIQEAMKERQENLQQIEQQLNEMRKGSKHVGEVIVQYQASATTNAAFQLTYLINGAGWTPTYDLRVSELTEPVELTYGAIVQQNTGEDWEDVELTLSTGNPRQQQNAPVIRTWWLNPNQPMAQARAQNYYDGITQSNVMIMSNADVAEEKDAGFAGAEISKNITNTEFKVRLPQDVPSDGQQYQVVVDNYELPADYQYYAAPKYDCHVYLTARVTDWQKYSLMPGQVNLFFDGSFIGKSQLNTHSAGDTLVFSLGRDNGIVIERTREEDFRDRRFLGTKIEQRIGWNIKVQKNRKNDVPIIIEDQIPVSTSDEMEVSLDQSKGASLNETTGVLRWEVDLDFGESKELNFRYSVKHSKNLNVVLE